MTTVSSMIDHTVLKAESQEEEVIKLCKEAMEYGFKAVCINPTYVGLAKDTLKSSGVKVATVIGFPLGANTSEVKAFETENAILNGADEVDMVINIGNLKDKKYDLVKKDIEAVVNAAKGKALVKVITENCLLSEEEKIKAYELSMEAGADYIKTSTGFSTGGATKEDISLMKSIVGNKLGIKASGGIRDGKTAQDMIDAGATRIGASAGIKIINDLK